MGSLDELVDARIDSRFAELKDSIGPRRVEVARDGVVTGVTPGAPHKDFEEVIDLVKRGYWKVLLTGPAGTGKSRIARDLSAVLGLAYTYVPCSRGMSEANLYGRLLPGADNVWTYQESRLVHAFHSGGVVCLEEIDAADGNLLISLNAALEDEILVTPNGQEFRKHSDFYFLATANTFCRGGNATYTARGPLDGATLERFNGSTLAVSYDDALESRIVHSFCNGESDSVLEFSRNVREKAAEHLPSRIVSTRFVRELARRVKEKAETPEAAARKLLVGWTPDELRKVGL